MEKWKDRIFTEYETPRGEPRGRSLLLPSWIGAADTLSAQIRCRLLGAGRFPFFLFRNVAASAKAKISPAAYHPLASSAVSGEMVNSPTALQAIDATIRVARKT